MTKSRIVYPAASFQPPETCTEHEGCKIKKNNAPGGYAGNDPANAARVHSPTGKCIHCDPSFVPTGADNWCNCICHNKEHVDPAPTGKVSEGDEALAQGVVRQWAEHDLDEVYNDDYMRNTLNSTSLEGRFISVLATVRKEAAKAERRRLALVVQSLPTNNYDYRGNTLMPVDLFKQNVISALEAAANGEL